MPTYPQNPRPLSSPQAMLPMTTNSKTHDHLYDANRNHVVPYYYSETLTCMPLPNNVYSNPNKNRHTLASYPFDERQNYYDRKSKRVVNTPELSPVFAKGYHTQSLRPYSVLEQSCKSPVAKIQRPSSVVPMSEHYKPASFFTIDNDIKKSNEVPEWKARLQNDMPKIMYKGLEKPLRPICRIPNCKCSVKVDPQRYSEVRTLPTVTERTLSKVRNLSLPTLKLEELESDDKDGQTEAERDVQPVLNKPISEQHLGYV